MSSSIGSIGNSSSLLQYQTLQSQQPARVAGAGKDSDGDNDGSKPGEVENKPPVSATLGTKINTTA